MDTKEKKRMINRRVKESLEYGEYLSGVLYAVFLTLAILIFVCLLTVVIGLSVEFSLNQMSSSDFITTSLLVLGFCSAGLAFLWGFLIRHRFWLRRKILLWLEDAVELYARLRVETQSFGRWLSVHETVQFRYEGKKYVRHSGKPNKNRDHESRGEAFGNEYNRMAHILYSPRYDRVIFLKD